MCRWRSACRLLCAAYLFGHISGCHINPAVTIGMWALRRTKGREVPAYLVGQIIGAALGGLALWGIFESSDTIAKGKLGSQAIFSGASNGWADHSPGGFAFGAMVITEILFTALFVLVIAGTTRKSAIAGFAGIPIGLMLALVHLVTIPVDNTSVNPARSFATAIFADRLGARAAVGVHRVPDHRRSRRRADLALRHHEGRRRRSRGRASSAQA